MKNVFAKRRELVLEQLGETGVLVLAASPELIVGRDTELRYVVDAELYYLTGYTEPEAILVLAPYQSDARFTLFVRPRDPARELWTGGRGGVEAARERFGADRVYPIQELSQHLPPLLAGADVIHARLASGRPELDGLLERALATGRQQRPRTGVGPHSLTDPGVLLDAMRLIKDESELTLLREAARITSESFIETLARVHAGVGEWEIEASIEHGFRSRGAGGPAFPTIAAAGANAVVLHYTSNESVLHDGDLLLLDAGARYQMYCGDITRTVPVSGKFTTEQRDLYDVVQAAHAAAIAAVKPGVSVNAPHEAVLRVLAEGLTGLGLVPGSAADVLAEPAALKPYFPHRTSHWLGLDVHDVGPYATRNGPLHFEPGMVLTLEPAVYVGERGIGIRIEDDVVVTADGCDVLTAAVPA